MKRDTLTITGAMLALALIAAAAGCSTLSGLGADLQAASDGIAEQAARD